MTTIDRSQESLSWSEVINLTHAEHVERFGWCSCEDNEGRENPYDDCPKSGAEEITGEQTRLIAREGETLVTVGYFSYDCQADGYCSYGCGKTPAQMCLHCCENEWGDYNDKFVPPDNWHAVLEVDFFQENSLCDKCEGWF
jgi:hypothetical protein